MNTTLTERRNGEHGQDNGLRRRASDQAQDITPPIAQAIGSTIPMVDEYAAYCEDDSMALIRAAKGFASVVIGNIACLPSLCGQVRDYYLD